jgi:phytoene dehydrogenase-like protein
MTSARNTFDAVIVGAGHNGLVTAGYLARAGLRVCVLERRELVGGACVTEELIPGFHFSTCAMTCYALDPGVVRDLELRRHGFDVFEIDPVEFRPFPDGSHLVVWRDPERTAAEIGRLSRHDAHAYPAWVELMDRANALLSPWRATEPPTLAQVRARVAGTPDEDLLDRLMTVGFADLLDEHFDDDRVKAALVHAGDVGDPRAVGSSWPTANLAAGGALETMADVGAISGLVRGGMGGVTQAMARSAEAAGVEIRLGTDVRRIVMDGARATGVELVDGTVIRGSIVVSNADPKRTFLGLVGRDRLPADFAAAVGRLRTTVAYVKLHVALRELPDVSAYLGPGFDPHWIARFHVSPSIAAWQTAWHEAQLGAMSSRPIMSIQVPSVYDSTAAPPGFHAMTVFAMFAPVRPARGSWDDARAATAETIIETIGAYVPNLRRAIVDWRMRTPADQEQIVGLTDGNIHHLDQIPGQLLTSRPLPGWADYRAPVAGLWLCGAGTHPGGEVSGLPGHNAAHAILRAWPDA